MPATPLPLSLQSLRARPFCTSPALFACIPSDELFLPVADVPGPDSPAHWWLPDPAPGAGVAAQPDHGPQPDVVDDNGDAADSSDEETEALEAARMAYGSKFTKTTKDKSQPAASLVWKLEDATKMPKTCIREKEGGTLGTKYGPQLINIPPGENIESLRKMWIHLRPKEWLPKLVETANGALYNDPQDRNYRKTTEAEMETVLGLMLGAAVMGAGTFEE